MKDENTVRELMDEVERLDTVNFVPPRNIDAVSEAAAALHLWIAEREQEEQKVTKQIQRMDINS